MARQHRCPQCGAPHRLLAAQSRFRCDYCSALVELRVASNFEVWQIGQPRAAREAVACADRWLRAQGIEGARVEVESADWAAQWQVVSRQGEEHRADASDFAHPLLAQLPLPNGARVEPDAQLPPPPQTREEIEAAALAAFRDDAAEVETTRLIYQPIHRLRFRLRGRSIPALHLGASDQLLVAALPEAARLLPARSELLWGYAAFALGCVAIGWSLAAWPARLFALSLSLAAGLLAWRAVARARA